MHGSLAHQSQHSENGITIGSAAFAPLTVGQTDKPTDHTTSSVAIGCINTVAMLPKVD